MNQNNIEENEIYSEEQKSTQISGPVRSGQNLVNYDTEEQVGNIFWQAASGNKGEQTKRTFFNDRTLILLLLIFQEYWFFDLQNRKGSQIWWIRL